MEKLRCLALAGAMCGPWVWNGVFDKMEQCRVEMAVYPRCVTSGASCVQDMARWAQAEYGRNHYDAVIGHSMGGLIALMLAKNEGFCDKTIFVESNLRPAGDFFRNLMTAEHMQTYGQNVLAAFASERAYYSAHLQAALREDFDFTDDLMRAKGCVWGVYGDRGDADPQAHIGELNLPQQALYKARLSFVHNACHLPMIENPQGFTQALSEILMA